MKRGTARAKSKGGSCERAIREYFGGILSGEIIACEKMKQVAAHVLRDMDNTDPLYPYHYREEFAQKHVRFIESFCRLPSGRLGHDFKPRSALDYGTQERQDCACVCDRA